MPQKGQEIRIAIADDHPIFREGLRKLLSLEADLEIVAEAENGDEIIDMLRKHQPDILLLDLRMPGMDVIDMLPRIKAGKFKTSVIVLTASEHTGEHVLAMKYGASGIVTKQQASEVLTKNIRKVHGGQLRLDSPRQPASRSEPPRTRGNDEPTLSGREREIVVLVTKGCGNQEIAETLSVSEQTLEVHLADIFSKLAVSTRSELARHAVDQDIRLSVETY